MNIRSAVDALEKTKLNLNTNKNEAANRGLSASLPKNVTLSRNCTARSYAAVHRMNYGIGDSLLHKLEQANCPIASGGQGNPSDAARTALPQTVCTEAGRPHAQNVQPTQTHQGIQRCQAATTRH